MRNANLIVVGGSCNNDLTGSQYFWNNGKVNIALDSGSFQWSEPNAKQLTQYRKDHKPDAAYLSHIHIDHVLWYVYEKPCPIYASPIVVEQTATCLWDSFGLQNVQKGIANAHNKRLSAYLREEASILRLLDILEKSQLWDTDGLIASYADDLQIRVEWKWRMSKGRSGGDKKKKNIGSKYQWLRRLISDFVSSSNDVPAGKSKFDLIKRLEDVRTAIADLRGYRVDYSRRTFSRDKVLQVLSNIRGVHLDQPIEIAKDIFLTLYHAGHIIWSTSALIESPDHNLYYTGDLGRIAGTPYLSWPLFPEKNKRIDTLIIESTYGDRNHEMSYQDAWWQLLDYVGTRKWPCLIPTLANQRGSEWLVSLHQAFPDEIIWYYGSTLKQYNEICKRHGWEAFALLGNEKMKFTMDIESILSENICPIIVSPSGMLCGWSNQIATAIADDKNSRIITNNYLSENSPWRQLVDTGSFRTELGDTIKFQWEVFHINGTSWHIDQQGIVDTIIRFITHNKTRTIILGHGWDQRKPLIDLVKQRLQKVWISWITILAPSNGDKIDLTDGKIVGSILR